MSVKRGQNTIKILARNCENSLLKNRTIANSNENKTTFETFFGIKPNVKNLKIYRSKVFVRKPEALRKG